MTRPHPVLLDIAAGRTPGFPSEPADLLRSAFEHRMQGLLSRHVRSGVIDVPDDLRNVLSMESVHTEMRHIGIWDALTGAVDRLSGAGIEVAAFKGVAAEQRWYEAIGDRPCWDVDLLMAPHQLDRVREAVERIAPHHRLAPEIQDLVSNGHVQSVTLRFGTTEIDLHFDLFKFGYGGSQPSAIWERTELLAMEDGSRIRVLDREVSLVHFLYHLNRDKFKRLLGFVDVARILADQDLDRAFVRHFVMREGLATQYALALRAVTDTLELPDEGIPVPGGWRSSVWRIAWRPSTRLLGVQAEVRFLRRGALLLPALVHGREKDTIRYWFARLFPPTGVIDMKHPSTKGPYLWRLVSGRVAQRWQRARLRFSVRHRSHDAGKAGHRLSEE